MRFLLYPFVLFNLLGCEDGMKFFSTQSSTQSMKRDVAVPSFKDCPDCPELIVIPSGTFLMGTTVEASSGEVVAANEQPQHSVTVKSFAMGKFEVTQAQWYAVMGTTPSRYQGSTLPVERVSWAEAQAFVQKLSLIHI